MTRAVDHVRQGARRVADRPLLRNARFQLLWSGGTSGLIGFEIMAVTCPLTILWISASPLLASLFGTVQTAALILGGLPAGQLVDHCDVRRVLLGAEALRIAATASIAVAAGTGHLSVPHVLAVAAVLGVAQPFGGAARMLLVRAVVPAPQLTAALTQEEVRGGIGRLTGPPLGGALLAVARAAPFAVATLAFAGSWLTVFFLRPPDGAKDFRHPPRGDEETTAPRERTQLLAGIRELARNPLLRTVALVVTAFNLASAPMVLAVMVLLSRRQVSSTVTGAVLMTVAVGSLLGAPLVGPLHRRLRPGILLLLIGGTQSLLLACLALPFGTWWIAGVLLGSAVGVPALSVLLDVLIFRQVPAHVRGRTITAVMTAVGVGIPIGTAVTGVLLEFAGATGTLLCLAALLALSCLYAATRPALRRADWPD